MILSFFHTHMLTVAIRLITGQLLKVATARLNLGLWLMNYLRKIIGTFKVRIIWMMVGRKSCYLYTLVEKRKSKNKISSTLANRVIGHA